MNTADASVEEAGPGTQAGDGGQRPDTPKVVEATITIVDKRSWWQKSWDNGAAYGANYRAWFSLWRQRIILSMRYAFRIPMDDVHENDLRNLAHSMKVLAQQNVQLANLVNSLNSRLTYYEQGPLGESHDEYVNNLEVGVMMKQGIIPISKRNGHPR